MQTTRPDNTLHPSPSRRRLIVTALVLAGATLVTTFVAVLSHLRYVQKGLESDLVTWLVGESFDWFSWALLVPLIIWLARKVRISRKTLFWSAPLHFLFSVLAAAFTLVVGVLGSIWAHNEKLATAEIIDLCYREIVWMLPWSIFIYSGIVAVYYALDYYRQYNERELRASRLESELTRAQLETLHTQLQPHFLFNTLNSISVLMRKGEIDTAQHMLNRLSDLLRYVLAKGGTQVIQLEAELEIVRGYLEIEQVRFGDRLQVEMTIDQESLKAEVPSFVLQTLVENAVRHGLAHKTGKGTVRIGSRREENRLVLTVEDDGIGLAAPSQSRGEGVGLRSTRTRLSALYADSHQFDLTTPEHGGTIARLEIPFRTVES